MKSAFFTNKYVTSAAIGVLFFGSGVLLSQLPNGRTQAGLPKFGPPVPETQIKSEVDPLDDSTRYLLIIHSTNEVANAIGVGERASLVVRCDTKGMRDFYINTPTFNGILTDAQVPILAVRWGDGAVRNEAWDPGVSSDAFFSSAPLSDLDRATKADTLTIGWNPYSSTRQSAKFGLDTYRSDLTRMLELCSA